MPQHSDRVKDKLREIEARELAVLKKIKTYRDGNLIEFFDRPNPLQEKLLDAWVNPLYKVFTFSGSNRLGKCLTYRTLIDTPQGRVSIGELYKAGKSFKVYAWNGKEKIVANANPPIKKKGLHKCYNLNMSNGDVPGCADYHRVLTSHGWFSVERLRASFGTLQGSSLVHDPLALISGDLHWNETERGSLAHCFHEFHQYGGRLLSLIGGGLFSSPLRGGVQPHNGLLCSSDALERIYKNTLQLISGLLSNLYGFHLVLGRYAGFLYHAVCRFLTLGGIYSQFVQRPIFESCLPFQSIGGFLGQANLKKGHPFLALHSFLCNSFGLLKRSNQVVQKPILKFSGQSPPIGGFDQLTKNVYHDNVASYEPPFRIIGNNQIESITPISSRQEVYDFEVPGYKNYFAGGIVHHNTTIGTVIAFATLFGYWPWGKKEKLKFPHTKPRKVRYIGQDWEKQIKTVLVPELEKWWPDNRVVSKKKNNQGIDAFWTDELTGSTLELMSNGQEPELHEGWSGDLIIFDEPCKRKIRIANARGLIDRQGRELFCMTLLKEAWISREIIKAVDENGCPDPTVFNVSGDISNNVGFGITQEGVDQFVKTLTPDEYDARIRGIPSYMSGLVYPSFSREKHIKQRFKIPLDWVIDIAIDVHPRVEQAILFCAVSPRGDKYLCNEIWEHGDGTWVGEEIIRCINFCKYRVGSIIIDPLSKGDRNNENTVYDKVQAVLWQHGYVLQTAAKDKTSGILSVKDHFVGANKEPSLFVFDDMPRTIYELEGYMYDKETQKPIDAEDHFCENLYRLMLLDTKWSELSYQDEGEEDSYIQNQGRDMIGGY